MDPALWELLQAEDFDPHRPVEAIIRLRRPGIEVPAARMVARFGSVATCRIAAADVVAVREHPDVISLKAARPFGVERTWEVGAGGRSRPRTTLPTDLRRPAGAPNGAEVVVGCVDWGLDFASATFRHPSDGAAPFGVHAGGTRLLALWDQREQTGVEPPDPYGYGAVHDRAAIDGALLESRPYDALGYHHADADHGNGTHAQHVLDIAAGNGRDGGPIGIAPGADLVFVHLAQRGTGGLANLGDSVRLLEALDFICRTAAGRPCVINVSMGAQGGPHDGTTLVEIAIDELLFTTPGLQVVKSAGNYFRSHTHATGKLAVAEVRALRFRVDSHDPTPNELEIWYDGADELAVRLTPPNRPAGAWVPLGGRAEVAIDGRVAGRIHHRAADPNNGANHIDAFLFPPALGGIWTVTLQSRRTRSGWFHAWLERDNFCPRCQARFIAADSDSSTTTGTLANSHLDLTVGAYDGHSATRSPAPFSSAGPTVDGRDKPDLVSPGVDVLAARSASAGVTPSPGLKVRKSGTSMAAPHVTGAVALCLQIGFRAGYLLPATLVRDLVLGSCDAPATPESRLGRGYLNIPRLLEATRAVVAETTNRITESPMNTSLLASNPATAYRELLYRSTGDYARAIRERFDVVALPGTRPIEAPQTGDVLLEVELGRLGRGRSIVLDGPLSRLDLRSLQPGQLLLRPRAATPPDIQEDIGHPGLDRLIDRGLSENQITNALFFARNPRHAGTTLGSGSGLARMWQVIRDKEVRPRLRARVQVSVVNPVELAVFLSQYENDDRVPAELTTKFLTGPPLLSLGRSLRDWVLANWHRGGPPLTAQRLFQLALELGGDAGTAALLCHNVTKAFVREGIAITWRGTGKEGEYTDGQKTHQARRIHRSGQPTYFHSKKKREVVSIFYLLFSAREFGTTDPGDWYHFFVTATMTALSAGGSLAPTSARGRRPGEATDDDEVVRGGTIGGTAYRTVLSQQLADLEKKLTDGSLAAVPGYRGWVLANALSFLEGGHYGGDQSDVERESRIHLRGAAFGLQAIGSGPGRTWVWHVPIFRSLSELDLATGYRVRDKTWQVWDTKGKPQSDSPTKASPAAQEANQEGGLDPEQELAIPRVETKPASPLTTAGTQLIKNVSVVGERELLASQFVLLANLYSQGLLTPDEFASAKRRILDT